MADPKTIVIQLRHIQPGQQWSTRRGNPLRFMVWAGADQPLDGTLQLAVELHPQSASGGTMPLAAATVELPTGESATVDFSADKMALDLGGLKAMTLKVVVVRVDEGGDPDTVLTGSLIVEGNPSSAQMEPGGPVYMYATTSMLAAERGERQELEETVSGMTGDVAGLSEEQASQAERLTAAETAITTKAAASAVAALEAAVPGKASRDLTDAVTESVGTRLLGPGVVTLEKLDPAVRSSMSGGLTFELLQGNWNAATNTPAIPVPGGNNGKWYHVNTGGVATGNAAGTYAQGDRIVSDGTKWIQLKAPVTVIPDGSLSRKAFADTRVSRDRVLSNGARIVKCLATRNGTESILTVDDRGKLWPDPEASSKARLDALEPKTDNLGEGLLPQNWVKGYEVWEDGCWIMHEGNHIQLIRARLTKNRLEVISGEDKDGTRYPRESGGGGGGGGGYTPPNLVAFGQDDGGVGVSDATGERSVITESAPWRDLHPTDTANEWIGRSPRLTGRWGLQRVNILTRCTVPVNEARMHGVGVAGQSLSAGAQGVPILSDTPVHPAHNFMFNGGLDAGESGVTIPPSKMASLVPMYQTLTAGTKDYETAVPGAMNRLNTMLYNAMGRRVKTLAAIHGSGGKSYAEIKQGTPPYNNGIYEVQRGKALANALGLEYIYLATMFIHGEQDRVIGTSAVAYESFLKEFLANETTDYQLITGQPGGHVMFICGCHSWTAYNFTTPTVTLGQLAAALSEPRIKLVTPKYIFPYADGVHMTGEGYRRLGEYYAKSKYHVLFGGREWHPFAPVEIGQTSDRVWARMRTPLGHSIRFNTALVSDPGRYGFEFLGGSINGTPYIEGDVVMIPKTSGTPSRLRYAHTGIAMQRAGPLTGPRGCLCDTDPSTSDYDGTALPNYCNTFDMAVPPAP